MKHSITDKFARLGAPLRNPRWSWGAVRPGDGTVFLRVWQDESRIIDGIPCMLVHTTASPEKQGQSERDYHLTLIEEGARCLLVIVQNGAAPGKPRRVGVVHDTLHLGGRLYKRPSACGNHIEISIARVGRVPHMQAMIGELDAEEAA